MAEASDQSLLEAVHRAIRGAVAGPEHKGKSDNKLAINKKKNTNEKKQGNM